MPSSKGFRTSDLVLTEKFFSAVQNAGVFRFSCFVLALLISFIISTPALEGIELIFLPANGQMLRCSAVDKEQPSWLWHRQNSNQSHGIQGQIFR